MGRRARRRVLLVLVLLLTVAVPVRAQSIYGELRGLVHDPHGEPLPGVQVEATSPALAGTRTAVSDGLGEFRIVPLEPGLYRVVLARPGFEVHELERLEVPLGGVAAIDVVLERGAAGRIVATAAPTLELTSAEVAERLLPVLLDQLPRPLDHVLDRAAEAPPRVRVNGLRFAGAPEELPQLPPAAVAALRVLEAAPTASEPGGWTPVVDLVTPAGGNTVRGTLLATISGGPLQGDAVPPPAGLAASVAAGVTTGAATVGGMVRWDRLWYYLAGGASDGSWEQDEQVPLGPGMGASQRQWQWDARRRWGHGRLTWRPAQRHTFSLWALAETDRTLDRPRLSPAADGADLTADDEHHGLTTGFVWQGLTSQSMMIEAAAGGSDVVREIDGGSTSPLVLDATSAGAASGGPLLGGLGLSALRAAHDASEAWFRLGVLAPYGHVLTFGARAEVDRLEWRSELAAAADSVCLPIAAGALELEPGGAEPLRPDCNQFAGGGSAGVQVPRAALVRGVARDGEWWALQVPDLVEQEEQRLGLFVEDEWRPRDNVTVRLGLRADVVETDATWSGRLMAAPPRLSFDAADTVAPRVSAVWDPTRRGRVRLLAGFSRTVDPVPSARELAFSRSGADLWVFERAGGVGDVGQVLRVARTAPWWSERDLRPGAEDELVVGAEAEVDTDMVVGLRHGRRWLHEALVVTSLDGGGSFLVGNPGQLFETHPITGAPFDAAVRLPEVSRYGRVSELWVRRRLADGWQLQASLAHHRSEGNLPLAAGVGEPLAPFTASPLLAPELFVATARGRLPADREWRARLSGSHTFDFGATVGIAGQWSSGAPLSRLGAATTAGLDARFVGARGSAGRTPDLLEVDLHIGWPMRLRSVEGEVVCNILNLTDRQEALVVDERWTVLDEVDAAGMTVDEQRTNPLWGSALQLQAPRRVELGLRLTF